MRVVKFSGLNTIIETNPDIILMKRLHSIQDTSFPTVETALQKHFDKERKKVVKAVEAAIDVNTIQAMATAQLDDKGLAELLRSVYEAVKEPVSKLYAQREIKFLPNGWWQFFLHTVIAERVVQIERTTTDQIKEIIAEGIREGYAIPTIAKLIDDLYLEQIIPNRSTVISRTEVIHASNAAAFVTGAELGIPVRKRWLSTFDTRTRDSHIMADGQTREPNEAFQVGNSNLLFPGDTSQGAEAHEVIQCRCAVVFDPL